MTPSASVRLNPSDHPVMINPGIYGQYFEHVEDCVYPGLMDETGVREDVIEAATELQVPIVRWPGGCFADLYHWQDGVGDERPVRRNWHWGNGELESNRFGTDEFLSWCEQVGAEALINVNLGTGDLVEALRWLDYCNGVEATADVLERHNHGRKDPWNVRYWGIGNETWGHWEAGCSGAADYAAKLANWADFFKRYDADLDIVAVGSDAGRDPDWDRTVLEQAGRHIDLLSIHLYGASVEGREVQDRTSVISTPVFMEKRINDLAERLCQYARETGQQIGIAMDEWNIRHYTGSASEGYRLHRAGARNGTDALFAAGVFHAMIRNAELVRLANYVFLVNGNAVLDARDGTVTRSDLFWIFQTYRSLFAGERIDVAVSAPSQPRPPLWSSAPDGVVDPCELPEQIDSLDAVASRDDDGAVHLAMINRGDVPLDVEVSGLGIDWLRRQDFSINAEDESLMRTDNPITGSGERSSVRVEPCASVIISSGAPG